MLHLKKLSNRNLRLFRNALAVGCLPWLFAVALHATVPSGVQTPFGNVDTPVSGSTNLAGAISVTGWALESSTMQPTVKVYRQPILAGDGPGPVFVNAAYFVPGTRPDVAAAYPGYFDNNYGWGLELLTNTLPDSANDGHSGNGTYTLYIQACDPNGVTCAYLTPTAGVIIHVNNTASKAPFGAIETPLPGQTYSGGSWVQGWALTPQSNMIPTNGSTVQTVVDGQILGPLSNYNLSNSGVAALFPGLQNTNGPSGNYYLNTAALWNGLHAVSWLVTDSAGNASGVGSEWIWVNNPMSFSAMVQPSSQTTETCGSTAASSPPYLYASGSSATYCGGCSGCTISGCWIDYYNVPLKNWYPDGTLGLSMYNSNASDSPGSSNAFSVTFTSYANDTFGGQRTVSCTEVSNLGDWSYNMNLEVFDPTPQINSITLSQALIPGGSAAATISGSNFGGSGTITACPSTSACTSSPVTASTASSWSPTQIVVALNAAATATGTYYAQVTSNGDSQLAGYQGYFVANQAAGGSSAQSNQQAVQVTPQYNISYSAYIPVDHVSAALSCLYGQYIVPFIYMGDANRGTYRATESILMQPDISTSSALFINTGQTRQYAYGSPANGSTLSSLDEDGIANDCYLWNNAQTASTSGMYSSVSYPFASQGQFLAYGSAGNPLESDWAAINWNINTVVNDPNPAQPTAYVNYNHTCYPAHIVKVNNQVIYTYTPPSNTPAYIGLCLTGINPHVTGQTSPVVVPNH